MMRREDNNDYSMEETTAVSVIIPFYNTADYLSESVESVLSQTLRGTELILVDDGSDDGSGEIAEEYRRQYPQRVRVLHQKNQGPAAARNAGLDIARGQYVHFLDSDDRLVGNALEILYGEAVSRSLDIVLFCAKVFSDDPALQYDVTAHRDEFIRSATPGTVMSGRESLRQLYEELREEYPAPVWTRLYSREYLVRCGIRYPEGLIHEDEDFGFFTYLQAERVEQIGDVLLERRLRRGSIMYTKKLLDSVNGYRHVYLKIIDACERTASAEDRFLYIRHSERMIFYTLLFYHQADADARRESRPVIDAYMDRARTYRLEYSIPVQQAMDWYYGKLPEEDVQLPALPYLCYK